MALSLFESWLLIIWRMSVLEKLGELKYVIRVTLIQMLIYYLIWENTD